MEIRSVDVAVIGAGTAGMVAYRTAAQTGARVAMIEGGPYGTTCARVGCMPSKLLIAAADAAHEVAGAGRFGVRVPDGVRVDGGAVLERVRRERDRFVGFVLDGVEGIPADRRLRGWARFVGPTTLEVDDHTRVEARAVVIASGSRPRIPPSLAALREHVLVNDDIFELRELPASLAVVGTGVIGLEIGQAMHRLGVRTSFFSHSARLGPVGDPLVAAAVADVLGAELDLHLSVALTARRDGGALVLAWQDADGAHEQRFDAVLAATGRVPNLDHLQLERAGLALDDRGLPRFDPRTMQCGDAPIFLAGDVSDDRAVLHEATDEGRIAGANAAAWPEVFAHPRRTPLTVAFTDPNLALVGTPLAELAGEDIEIGTVSYADQGRARVMARNAGLVRIYARRACGTLLGAEMFGPRVEHTAHLLAWAVQSHTTVEQALAMPVYHPVIEEGIRTALRDLSARLKLREPECPQDMECGPGA
jgi:dihydrolipoamide dehydrogenase